MRLDLGLPVYCVDGAFGELADVTIEPRTRRLTHLVIQPHDRHDHARLVPAAEAHSSQAAGGISLDQTVAQISRLEPIQRSAYLGLGETPVEDSTSDVGIQDIAVLPGYGSFGPQALGSGVPTGGYDQHVTTIYDRVPKGEVEIRRSSSVMSPERHPIGHVIGFVIDHQQQILHLILEHGHLWGKRQVAVPAAAILEIENDVVVTNMSSDQVGALKPLPPYPYHPTV
jgi:uncharacterized protein YrrD